MAKRKYEEEVDTKWNDASFFASLKSFYEETVDTKRLLEGVAIKPAAKLPKELVDQGEFAARCKEQGGLTFDILKESCPEFLPELLFW